MQKIQHFSLNNPFLSYIIYIVYCLYDRYFYYFAKNGEYTYVYTKIIAIVACFNGISATDISDNLYI